MNTVTFRDFEERDIDFIYRCKNDEKLNSLIVGHYHPFTYEEAVKWVHGCMGEYDTFKFWAICTNDDEKRIVGWVSLSEIDYSNKSACFHGLVIGDQNYHDGFTWIESYLHVYKYAFEHLGLNRVYGTRLVEHKQTRAMGLVMFSKREGILRQALYKNGQYHDLSIGSLLSSEYFEHKKNGDYEIHAIVKRIKQARKEMNDEK
jgi:RimJ/RimL family protein N-acetyltransferase